MSSASAGRTIAGAVIRLGKGMVSINPANTAAPLTHSPSRCRRRRFGSASRTVSTPHVHIGMIPENQITQIPIPIASPLIPSGCSSAYRNATINPSTNHR